MLFVQGIDISYLPWFVLQGHSMLAKLSGFSNNWHLPNEQWDKEIGQKIDHGHLKLRSKQLVKDFTFTGSHPSFTKPKNQNFLVINGLVVGPVKKVIFFITLGNKFSTQAQL